MRDKVIKLNQSPGRKEEVIKLNLGCGWRDFGKDWIHIDGGNYKHLNSKDITDLPYEDNKVDLIYSSHTIEYFDREEVIDLLVEWKRVLKPGGKIQLCVPNFLVLAKLYLDNDYPIEMIEGPLFGKMHMGKSIIYHKTTYDFKSLSGLLTSLGFKQINIFEPYQEDYSKAVRPRLNGKKVLISLNVEAIK